MSPGGKMIARGPTDQRNVAKKTVEVIDRYRGAVSTTQRSSNRSSGSSPVGQGLGDVGNVVIRRATVKATSSSQTTFTFTGTDVDGFTSTSVDLLVFLNGLLLDPDEDYSLGSDTVTLTEAVGAVGYKVSIARYEVA